MMLGRLLLGGRAAGSRKGDVHKIAAAQRQVLSGTFFAHDPFIGVVQICPLIAAHDNTIVECGVGVGVEVAKVGVAVADDSILRRTFTTSRSQNLPKLYVLRSP